MARAGRGVAIPTAMFFVIVLFFIASVVLSQAQMNIRLGGRGALERQQFYAAQGLANRAILELGLDPQWQGYSRDNPLVDGHLELITEFISDGTDLVHVKATAYPAGQSAGGVTVSKTLHQRNRMESRSWAIAPVFGPGNPESVFFRGDSDNDWNLIPPAPRKWYDPAGNPQTMPGYASNLFSMHPGTRNDVYALYFPMFDVAGPLSDIARVQLESQLVNRNNRSATQPLLDLVDVFGDSAAFQAAMQGVSVMRYDGNSWEALPPLPGARYDGGNPVETGDFVLPGMLANTDVSEKRFHVSVLAPGPDFLYRYDLESGLNGSWEVLNPPSATIHNANGQTLTSAEPASHIFSTAEDAYGGLYAHTGKPGQGHAVQRRDPDSGLWEVLDPVPNLYYDESGQLVDAGGAATEVADLHVGFNDELYISHIRSIPGSAGLDTTFVYRNDRWQPVPQPHLYTFDSQGSETEQPELVVNIDSTAMDAEGQLLLHARVLGQPDVNYRYLDGQLESVLEPLPRTYYDSNGVQQQEAGFFDLQLQVGGGGSRVDGRYRYKPVGDF